MEGVKTILLALELARVIAGETPGCPVEAKLAVAHVAANRIEAGIDGGWFGDGDPTPVDLALALYWDRFRDPTAGALWMIGPGDVLPWIDESNRTGRWECPATWVETYR